MGGWVGGFLGAGLVRGWRVNRLESGGRCLPACPVTAPNVCLPSPVNLPSALQGFFQCIAGGIAAYTACPNNLLYNIAGYCDWDYNVVCEVPPTASLPPPEASSPPPAESPPPAPPSPPLPESPPPPQPVVESPPPPPPSPPPPSPM
jgi:hypothetical protein